MPIRLLAASLLLACLATTADAEPDRAAVDRAAADAAELDKLEKVIPELTFEAVELTEAIDRFRYVTRAHVFVNWRALEAAGIDRTALVTVRVRNVKASTALTALLGAVVQGRDALGFSVDDGAILVTTKADLADNLVTKVYDVRELIVGRNAAKGDVPPADRQRLADDVVTLIVESVEAKSWRKHGGLGSARHLSGQVIVTQTPDNHRTIDEALTKLRQQRE